MVCSRTASTSRLTRGMPSASAPDRPARRSTARSTETVVCVCAISTIGWPALAASARASRTTAGSRLAGTACLHRPSPPAFSSMRRSKMLAHAGLGPDEIDGQLRVPRNIPVADEHRDVGGEALGAERGGSERSRHREEDHRAALGRGEDRAALAAGNVARDTTVTSAGRAAFGRGDGARDSMIGSRASAITTSSTRPCKPPADVAASRIRASASCGTTPMIVPAPATRAAAADSEPLLPAAPIIATTGA